MVKTSGLMNVVRETQKGKTMTTATVIPKIGGSASYSIGSDTHHQIIVRVERNGKTVKTYPAEVILKSANLDLEAWNELSDNDRLFETHKAIIAIKHSYKQYESNFVDDATASDNAHRWFDSSVHEFTARNKNGKTYFLLKGENYGHLEIGSQYSYRDPHF
jgi:hypothetical protein